MSDENDAAIAEIRQVRHGISERLGHDPRQVIVYYIELQRQYAGRCLPTEGEELPEEPLLTSHTLRQSAFSLLSSGTLRTMPTAQHPVQPGRDAFEKRL